jgi:hypothetical protein
LLTGIICGPADRKIQPDFFARFLARARLSLVSSFRSAAEEQTNERMGIAHRVVSHSGVRQAPRFRWDAQRRRSHRSRGHASQPRADARAERQLQEESGDEERAVLVHSRRIHTQARSRRDVQRRRRPHKPEVDSDLLEPETRRADERRGPSLRSNKPGAVSSKNRTFTRLETRRFESLRS